MSPQLRLRIGAGLASATVVLLAVALIGAFGMRPDDGPDGPEVLAAAGSSVEDLAPEPTTPSSSPAPTPSAPDGGSSPAAVPVPAVATTTPAVTPAPAASSPKSTAPPANPPPPPPAAAAGLPPGPPPTVDVRKTFAISPTSGSGTTGISASGTGCTGGSVGVSLTIIGPGGVPVGGDGGGASADGGWRVPFSIGANAVPGSYSVQAVCRSGAQVLFGYPSQTFTVTA